MVREAGDVWCWGQSEDGEIGQGVDVPSDTPQRVDGLPPMQDVFMGGSHTCANEPGSGNLWCWGSNAWRQIGLDEGRNVERPILVGYGGRVFDVAIGTRHTCAALTHELGTAVRCRGSDLEGQLLRLPMEADGTVEIPVPRPFAISAEDKATCVATEGGVFCWGRLLGHSPSGSRIYRTETARVDLDATDVGVGRGDVTGAGAECAVVSGSLHCWAPSVAPTERRVDGLSDVTEYRTRYLSACVRAGGRALCRGANFAGQLGDGTTDERERFVPVVGLGDIASLDVGERHACALDTRGRVFCWGSNMYGQLGVPGPDQRTPVRVELPDSE